MSNVYLVAGGTGGHINAALAIGEALAEEKHNITYLTGKRPLDYKLFHGQNVRHLSSRPLRTSNPVILIQNIFLNISSFLYIFILFVFKRPKFVIGAGGYVCGPTLLAGWMLFVPVFIIEQNAVMGLTNKILGWFSKKIFVHFSKTKGLSNKLQDKVCVVGNPTRKSIKPVSFRGVEKRLKVLVFGGSLGAKQINELIYFLLEDKESEKLSIHHQVGGSEKITEPLTKAEYVAMNYIEDMQKEYDWCDVIVSRAGASTISELAIIQKPVFLIPYPKATDNHQFFNAMIFKEESSFTVEIIDPLTSQKLAQEKLKEFLTKAFAGKLKYAEKQKTSNETCVEIIKEIKKNVRMA